jgi:predicted DCC family thiol-disulfide oxidoreductase YuxK
MSEYRVILFDGVCNLCNASVDFILAHEARPRFQFAALQSEAGQRLLAARGLGSALPESVILVDGEAVHTRSTAALQIARHLRFPWSLLFGLVIIPRPLRDAIYAFVARRRQSWFGVRLVCRLPTPAEKDRFLDWEDVAD